MLLVVLPPNTPSIQLDTALPPLWTVKSTRAQPLRPLPLWQQQQRLRLEETAGVHPTTVHPLLHPNHKLSFPFLLHTLLPASSFTVLRVRLLRGLLTQQVPRQPHTVPLPSVPHRLLPLRGHLGVFLSR